MTFPVKPSHERLYAMHGSEKAYQKHLTTQFYVPFNFSALVDLVQAERNCFWENCTTKGGYSNAPFVNRWKAQMLVNTLCSGGYPYHHPANYTESWTVEDFVEAAGVQSSSTEPPADHDAPVEALPSPRGSDQQLAHLRGGPSVMGRIEYVPFPHRDIGIGDDAACRWEARDVSNRTDPVVASLLGRDVAHPDLLQRSAFEETLCVPESNRVLSKLHVFSTRQARKCLENVTLAIVGDSYTRNLFIELGSVLFGRMERVEIVGGSHRTKLAAMVDDEFQDYRERVDPAFPRVRHICFTECFGRTYPFWRLCSDCVNEFRREHKREEVVLFAGVGVHINKHYEGDLDKAAEEIKKLWSAAGNMIFASLVNYQTSKVPEQYRGAKDTPKPKLYRKELEDQERFQNVRLFDYYELTKSCRMENCTTDGGHRAHFVNRWKAQLLLNTLCSYS